MKVLVTGAAGYIGSVLVRQLLAADYLVRGLDNLTFGGHSLLDVHGNNNFEFIPGDIGDEKLVMESVGGVDAVIHLAAIVGDVACAKEPVLAEEVNWQASKSLFDFCLASSSVERFIFASTCSNYGRMAGDTYVDESTPLKPVSLYADLKVRFEEYLLNADVADGFSPTALRFSTVYGLSPRIRFDLTVNEFMRDVALGQGLTVYGEQFWRPYCHVEDIASACILVLESATKIVRQNVFGVGLTHENYQKKMIVEEILRLAPGAAVTYVHKDEDPRDYKVDFSKIKNELGFAPTKTVPDGLREIQAVINAGLISDPDAQAYRNS